jgi:hypothetical protein
MNFKQSFSLLRSQITPEFNVTVGAYRQTASRSQFRAVVRLRVLSLQQTEFRSAKPFLDNAISLEKRNGYA